MPTAHVNGGHLREEDWHGDRRGGVDVGVRGRDQRQARQVAEALGVWHGNMDARQAALAVADMLEALYTRIGVPTRLRQLEIPRDELPLIAKETVKNFNANAGVRSAEDQIQDALRLLEAAY